MKIKTITIGGFKNLKKTKIEVKGIIALVSPNNFGKSNFLQGIDFALAFLNAGEKGRKKMMAWTKGIPMNPASENDPFSFEIEFYDSSLGNEYQYVRYGFSFAWLNDDAQGQRIIDEWLEMRKSPQVKYTRYLKRDEGRYRKSKSTNAYRNILLGDFQLAIDMLPSIEDIEYSPVLQQIKHISFKTCSSLDADMPYEEFPFEAEGSNLPLSHDMPKLLNHLKETTPDKFLLFKEAVTSLFPEISDVEVVKATFTPPPKTFAVFSSAHEEKSIVPPDTVAEPPFKWKNEIYRIFVKTTYMNQPIDITSLSAGTKRLLWIIAILFSSNRNTQLLGIEELETSIHPRLLKQTLELLNDNLGDTTLIITSHSPYLVQYIKLDKIYIGIPDTTGLASFKRIANSKIKTVISIAQSIGLSVGEYLFDLMAGDAKSVGILERIVKG
jgi:hypothetical protein